MVGHRFSFEWLSERGLCAWRLSLGVLGPHSLGTKLRLRAHEVPHCLPLLGGVPAQLQTPFLGFISLSRLSALSYPLSYPTSCPTPTAISSLLRLLPKATPDTSTLFCGSGSASPPWKVLTSHRP